LRELVAAQTNQYIPQHFHQEKTLPLDLD